MSVKIVGLISIFFITACGQQNNVPVTAKPGSEISSTALSGREIFQQNCVSCHAVNEELVGPPMAGAKERWNDKSKLYDFIRNAPKVIKEDKYAYDFWMKYNQTMMTPFPNLTDEDIDAIFEYVESQKK